MVSHETLPLLEVDGITKQYGSVMVLDTLSLNITAGHIVSILGRSGSGKSTLLRCIAGLESVGQGAIRLQGEDITNTPTHQRGIGMMFQQFALFPHRTVAENIAFGLRMRGDSSQSQQQRVSELLALVGLQGYERRSIFELSGGEQQRVALARSLAPNPKLLLLDEPMSSLDQTLRARLIGEIREILKTLGITALYITHDQQEAFTVADELVLLDKGKIVQQGTPEQVYRHPINRFAAEFFGIRNIVEVVGQPELVRQGVWRVQTALGMFDIKSESSPQSYIAFPAEIAQIVDKVDKPVDNIVQGVVKSRSFRGGYYEVVVSYPQNIHLTWQLQQTPAVNEPIAILVPASKIIFVAASS